MANGKTYGITFPFRNSFDGKFLDLTDTSDEEIRTDLIHLLFAEGNPAGIKEVLAHLDICENYLRLPLVPVSEKLSDKIRKYLVEEEFMS